jgi:hypothetical protein
MSHQAISYCWGVLVVGRKYQRKSCMSHQAISDPIQRRMSLGPLPMYSFAKSAWSAPVSSSIAPSLTYTPPVIKIQTRELTSRCRRRLRLDTNVQFIICSVGDIICSVGDSPS